MEKKKSTSASIENLRFPTVLVGLLFVGGLVLASFSYMTAIEKDIEPEIIKNVTEIVFIEEEQIEIDRSIELPEQHVFLPPDEEIIIDSNTEEAPPVVVTLPPPPLTLPIGDPNPPVLPAEIIDFPDVEAKFPGGSDELQYWINENIIYPQPSIEMNEQGRVYMSFVVERDGSISNIRIERGVSIDLDHEALRVLGLMPNWSAGETDGKKVRTRCRLPIIFTLE